MSQEPSHRRGGSIGRFLLVGGASVLLAQVVGMGSGTAGQMLLARLLEPEQLAAFFLIQSLVETGAGLANLGLPRPLTRFLAQAMGRGCNAEARGVLLSALPLWLCAVVVAALVYAGGLGDWLARHAFRSEIMATGSVMAAVWLVFQSSSDLLAGALRGFRRVGLAVWVGSALARLVTAAVLLGWYLQRGDAQLLPVLALMAASMLAACLFSLWPLWREVAGVTAERFPRRVLLASALPLLVTIGFQMLYLRVDLWAVGVLFEPDQVALYGAAKRLIVLTTLPLLLLSLVVPPVVAELHEQAPARLESVLRGTATLAGLPAIAVLVLFSFAGEWVLGLTFGPYFREAWPILALLCVERLAFVWVGASGMVLAMTGRERALMWITVSTGLLTALLVVVGARLHGFVGVAAGFAVGSSGQQIATWLTVRRTTGLRTDMDLRNLGAALDALRRALRG